MTVFFCACALVKDLQLKISSRESDGWKEGEIHSSRCRASPYKYGIDRMMMADIHSRCLNHIQKWRAPMMPRWFFSIAFCVLLVGCDALVTTNPLVKHGEAHLLDGRYVLMLKGAETPMHLTIAYDKTNSVYQIDAGKEGTFQALCRLERPDRLLVSLTLSNRALKNAYGVLAESERLFIARVYVNARLMKKDDAYDLWILNKAKDISDGCGLTALPSERLLSLLPPTNAPPFVYSGKLLRLGDDGGILNGDQSQVSLMNDEGRLNNDDKVLVNFLCGKDVAKNISITKSEDNRYLYYHMKFTNQQESCVIKIDKKSGEAVNVKEAEP